MEHGTLKLIRKNITCLLFLFILLNNNQNANAFSFQDPLQSFDEYKGRVISNDTKEPLAFADISVINSNLSTITNIEGEFTLKIPKSLSTGSIQVSFLGYKTTEVQLNTLKEKNNILFLKAIPTQLSQVNINAPKDAKSLVQAALIKPTNQYLNEKIVMTAFYRETIKKRKKNASLAEAVVKIYKEPYTTNKKDAVELLKSRKNTNYSRLDTLAVKLQGGPFSALYLDMVKYRDYIFNKDFFDYYTFNFDQSTEINNRKVYVINFYQLPNIVTPLYKGQLYIDAETFALISADYDLNLDNKEEAVEQFIKRKPSRVKVEPQKAFYHVDFKTTADGKRYFSYSNVQIVLRVKWRKKLFSSLYALNIEMVVTDWTNAITTKIIEENRLRPSVILSDKTSGFSDPEFWGRYNIIEPDKSIESAIKKISKQLSKIEKN